ncbi:uncharacterized protein LOC127566250 isoform X2 [Drosophila albomicans]|uniref:Uncharacterized protein LOC127566250 isoform X2 n=1 Tax=Drosophila albomicans TaxID=7291 RepID=A0A9C6TDB1_DROAB|nr:uncharacterized protein LOC127566250 isoform X2 [Drosophila albomicans]
MADSQKRCGGLVRRFCCSSAVSGSTSCCVENGWPRMQSIISSLHSLVTCVASVNFRSSVTPRTIFWTISQSGGGIAGSHFSHWPDDQRNTLRPCRPRTLTAASTFRSARDGNDFEPSCHSNIDVLRMPLICAASL